MQAVRHQAAAVVAALALSSPPLLAVLFGESLEGVETFCQQLMLLAAPYTKRGPVFSPGGSTVNSTGTGVWSTPSSVTLQGTLYIWPRCTGAKASYAERKMG
jgi:hypothetical protein